MHKKSRMEIVKKREHKNQRYFSHLTLDFLNCKKFWLNCLQKTYIMIYSGEFGFITRRTSI